MSTASPQVAAPGWPLAVVFLGLPIWWLLGLWQLMFLAMTFPMAVYLLRRRRIFMPRGYWLWMLWLAWVLLGLLVLQVDAPGTAGGSSSGRYLTFAFRFSWYVAATVVALYVVNTREQLTTERISRMLGWLFVLLIGGGLLGLLVPTLSFPSVLQASLPQGLANQQFVDDLLRVQVAQVQDFLGEPQVRPSAPFPYTNDWGLATTVALPFFVVSWWKRGGAWRYAMIGFSLLSAYVIVASVNRGMWGAIAAIAILLAARSILQGHLRMLLIVAAAALSMVAFLFFTPLGDLIIARFENPHSDSVRGNLGLQTVQSTAQGSSLVGFGTTREVAGTFVSIAGGASPDCPNCEPPPLGTHGQLWLVIFGAGFVGALLFVGFLVSQVLRNLSVRSPYGVAALCSITVLTVTLPIYSSVGAPLYVGFVAIGLLAREAGPDLPEMGQTLRPLLSHPLLVSTMVLLGGVAGVGAHAILGKDMEAVQRIHVPVAEMVPVPGTRPFTLDSEALLVTSEPVVASVGNSMNWDQAAVRDSIEISAEPNTRVLVVSFTTQDQNLSLRGAELVSSAYLKERAALMAAAERSVTERYTSRLQELDTIARDILSVAEPFGTSAASSTISDLQRESLEVADVLDAAPLGEVGQSLAPAAIRPSSDAATIRVAGGLGFGLMFAVLCAGLVNRRRLTLGAHPLTRLGLGIPVLERIQENDTERAEVVAKRFLPIAGLASDPTSLRALRLAATLENTLSSTDQAGRHSLLVVDERSRVGRVRRLYDEQVRAGLQPVGLIVCQDPENRG